MNDTPQLPLFTIPPDDFPPIIPIPNKRIKDLTGQRFVRLLVLGFAGQTKHKKAKWLCRCECSNQVTVVGTSLHSGLTQSCGCLFSEITTRRNTTHGMYGVAEYKCWRAMLNRCERPDATGYKYYGGKGITVCEEWRNSIEQFVRDMGPRPGPQYSIDRVDNNLGYFPENCRWATSLQQSSNTSRSHFLEYQGKRLTVTQWAKRLGMKKDTLFGRIHKGWTIEEVLTRPVRR